MTWLKLDHTTPDKPEVLAITLAMGWDDSDLTVGKLFKLWRWFDQHTVDGNAPSVSTALLDRVIGVSGFCNSVASVGWLVVDGSRLTLPNFDKHNGQTAKDRANTAKRVAKHAGKRSANDLTNGAGVSPPLPREEKNKDTHTPLAPDFVLLKAWGDAAIEANPHWTVDVVRSEAARFSDHHRAKATASADWSATWRLWFTDPITRDANPPTAPPKSATQGRFEKPDLSVTVPSNEAKRTLEYLRQQANRCN